MSRRDDSPKPDTRSWRSRLLAYSLPPIAAAMGVSAGHVLRSRLERHHTFSPTGFPDGEWSPKAEGLEVEDVWFFAPDGEELHGWWIPHEKARGTLLYCHGNAGSLADQAGALVELRRLGVHLFAFDYRGYGRSSGRPSQGGVLRDAQAAHDHVVRALGQPEESIVLLGHSLGGAIAIDCAVHRPVAGLIVQSSFVDTREMARELYPQVPMHWIARRRFRSIDKVRALEVPKLFVHGDCDERIPHTHGERLFEAAAEPKDLFIVPRAGHSDVHDHGGESYFEKLSDFCRACL